MVSKLLFKLYCCLKNICFSSSFFRQSRFELNRKLEEVNAHLEEQVRHEKEDTHFPNLRVRFFAKIQDWILKSENRFCVSLLNRLI